MRGSDPVLRTRDTDRFHRVIGAQRSRRPRAAASAGARASSVERRLRVSPKKSGSYRRYRIAVRGTRFAVVTFFYTHKSQYTFYTIHIQLTRTANPPGTVLLELVLVLVIRLTLYELFPGGWAVPSLCLNGARGGVRLVREHCGAALLSLLGPLGCAGVERGERVARGERRCSKSSLVNALKVASRSSRTRSEHAPPNRVTVSCRCRSRNEYKTSRLCIRIQQISSQDMTSSAIRQVWAPATPDGINVRAGYAPQPRNAQHADPSARACSRVRQTAAC